ncbi:MAG: hypothetical protein M3016_04430 [Actinomycetota bacterium]|nr:hypothetical protein [Actinomycetota bacterium]
MREVAGFILLALVPALCGFATLRALGLARAGPWGFLLAFGPSMLTGTAVVVLALVVLLVLAIPFTLVTAIVVAVTAGLIAFGLGVARRRGADAAQEAVRRRQPLAWMGATVTAAYVLYGALALGGLSTVQDDARIWSFKGVTLTYYDSLRPEVFLNPATMRAHHLYPLFQPILEALMNRAMGRLELRFFHAELWLLLIATAWTAAHLLWWRWRRPALEQAGVVALVALITIPAVLTAIGTGYADITGSMLVGVGALAVGLWLDGAERGNLWLGVLLLAAGASTKDEDLVAAGLVLVALAVALLVGRAGTLRRLDLGRMRPWLMAAVLFGVLIAPWRLWAAAHGVSDSVAPPLPHALSPVFLLDRWPQFKATAQAMAGLVLGNWGWLSSVFLALCTLAFISASARRLAGFYLLSFTLLVASLLWLYATTPVSLGFLIPTSASRTIDVFMMLTPFASAHLISRLLSGARAPGVGLHRAGDDLGVQKLPTGAPPPR